MKNGKIVSEETKKRMRESWKRRLCSPGFIPPRLGKKQSDYQKKRMSEIHKGKSLSILHKNKISLSHLNKKRPQFSKEWRENMSKSKIGIKTGNRSLETKKKMSISASKVWKEHRHSISWKNSNTPIEIKIQEFLKQLDINFLTHQYMNIKHDYQVDIYIPSLNLVIECDGNYWHNYPFGNEIDKIRNKELIEKGFKVLRLWESEIREMNINNFERKINF